MERCSICSKAATYLVEGLDGDTGTAPLLALWVCDEHAKELLDEFERLGDNWNANLVRLVPNGSIPHPDEAATDRPGQG